MPSTQSCDDDSLICTLVMLRFSVRMVLYSSLHVRLFCNVTSMPSSGENDSLMLTVETLYIDDGTGMPVVASEMKPRPGPINSMKVLYDWYAPTA